ncbi:MAG TPA: peptidase, partial [Gemmatimonadaceae bacterium]|nr:peptidase [Gemmatimonadaceae bacterium]
RNQLGRVTVQTTVPHLKRFLEEGGTIITIGTSTSLAQHLGLPLRDYMVERSPEGGERPLPREKFYVPGSILRVSVDNTLPVAAGVPDEVDVFFDESPVFRLDPDAARRGVKPIAWFSSAAPLRSGWAWGQNYLEGGTAMAQAQVGRGMLYLFGPEILFRAQPHGTFKFFFNGIFSGLVESAGRTVQ